MIKYTLGYEDFNGNAHSEDLWFHISKSSVLTMNKTVYDEIITLGNELQQKAKFVEQAEKSLAENPNDNVFDANQQIVNDAIRSTAQLLEKVVDLAYGVRTSDGMRFIQDAETIKDFKQTVAYDAFLTTMLTHPNEMVAFIEKLMLATK